jgi:hypothetical protein
MGLSSLVPSASQLLALEPEEVAGFLLEWMRSQPDLEWRGVHPSQYGQNFVSDYPQEFHEALTRHSDCHRSTAGVLGTAAVPGRRGVPVRLS